MEINYKNSMKAGALRRYYLTVVDPNAPIEPLGLRRS